MAGCQGLELGRMPEALDLAQPTRQWVLTGENLGYQPPLSLLAEAVAPKPSAKADLTLGPSFGRHQPLLSAAGREAQFRDPSRRKPAETSADDRSRNS